MNRAGTGKTFKENFDIINDNFDELDLNKADISDVQQALSFKVDKSSTFEKGYGTYVNSNGELETLEVTADEINKLAGITSNIQEQLDALPKFVYLDAIKITLSDTYIDDQNAINTAARNALNSAYPSVVKWNAATVGIHFTGNDTQKDALYYYNGTSWIFLNYVSTGINRADGTTAGIVENSDDIEFEDGQGKVKNAEKAQKTEHKLTIKEKGSNKVFDGSADVSVEIPNIYKIIQNGQELQPDDSGAVTIGSTAPIIKTFVTTSWVGSSAPYTITLSLDGRGFNGVVYRGTPSSNVAVLCDFSRTGDTVILSSDFKFDGFIEV